MLLDGLLAGRYANLGEKTYSWIYKLISKGKNQVKVLIYYD